MARLGAAGRRWVEKRYSLRSALPVLDGVIRQVGGQVGVKGMESCVAELLSLLQDPDLPKRCGDTAEHLFYLESGINSVHGLYGEAFP